MFWPRSPLLLYFGRWTWGLPHKESWPPLCRARKRCKLHMCTPLHLWWCYNTKTTKIRRDSTLTNLNFFLILPSRHKSPTTPKTSFPGIVKLRKDVTSGQNRSYASNCCTRRYCEGIARALLYYCGSPKLPTPPTTRRSDGRGLPPLLPLCLSPSSLLPSADSQANTYGTSASVYCMNLGLGWNSKGPKMDWKWVMTHDARLHITKDSRKKLRA